MTLPPDPEHPTAPNTPAAAHDRGVSPIAGRLVGGRGKVVTFAALALGCGVFLAATWDRGNGRERAPTERDAPPRELASFEPARRAPGPQLADAALDPDPPRLSGEPIPPLESPPVHDEGVRDTGAASVDSRQALADSAQRAPVLVYSRTGRAGASRGDDPSFPPETGAPTPLDDLRRAAPIGRAAAGRLPDRDLLITAGTSIPCVLQTAMDSTTPGYVSCVLPRDVYSESGGVVLLQRGARVLGSYQGGLQQGRRRLFVLWTRAVTPDGVTIALASPAADALGRAGFDGVIDTHFRERFGGALLLSLVDDGAYALMGGDGTRSGAARMPSDAAATALQGSIDIPPTLRKAPGSEVTIFVAQDLDFRGVYRLRPR